MIYIKWENTDKYAVVQFSLKTAAKESNISVALDGATCFASLFLWRSFACDFQDSPLYHEERKNQVLSEILLVIVKIYIVEKFTSNNYGSLEEHNKRLL